MAGQDLLVEPWFVSEPVTKCSICYVNLLGLGGGAAGLIEPMCSCGIGEGTLVRYNRSCGYMAV